jgi:acyl-CoA synthetase (AMP-forming)/AMP-acid ligase II
VTSPGQHRWNDERQCSGLLAWLDEPSPNTGLYVTRGGQWVFHPYRELADHVRSCSSQLRGAGIVPGERIGIVGGTAVEFLAGLFGALHAGCTPGPIPPAYAVPKGYFAYVARLLDAMQAGAAVTFRPEDAELVRSHSTGPRARPVVAVTPARVAELEAAEPPRAALVQLTSGSTGRPRAISVTQTNLESNLAMIRRWLGWDAGTTAASWLPLHHDMGLVGLFLGSVVAQTTLWQLHPREFLIDPVRWLECFGRHGATLTALPTFGLRQTVRRVSPAQLEGMDFSSWASAVVGAERICPVALQDFAALLSGQGFRAGALLPAYGLAEATLAVTGHRPGRTVKVVRARWTRMEVGDLVRPSEVGDLSDESLADGVAIASSGQPLDGIRVTVVDNNYHEVPSGTVGEVIVEGRSVTDEIGADDGVGTRSLHGRLATGDLGFMVGDDLFVLGRRTDALKVLGRRVVVEPLEAEIAESVGVPVHHCAVVPLPHTDGDGLAVVLEVPGTGLEQAVRKAVRRSVRADVPLEVVFVGPGEIPRTTSGKPRRRELRRRLVDGSLDSRATDSRDGWRTEVGV